MVRIGIIIKSFRTAIYMECSHPPTLTWNTHTHTQRCFNIAIPKYCAMVYFVLSPYPEIYVFWIDNLWFEIYTYNKPACNEGEWCEFLKSKQLGKLESFKMWAVVWNRPLHVRLLVCFNHLKRCENLLVVLLMFVGIAIILFVNVLAASLFIDVTCMITIWLCVMWTAVCIYMCFSG